MYVCMHVIGEDTHTMTVKGEAYINTLRTIHTIPTIVDLCLVVWKKCRVTKTTQAKKMISITRAMRIFR